MLAAAVAVAVAGAGAVADVVVAESLHKDSGRIAADERRVVVGLGSAAAAAADTAVGPRQAGYYNRVGNSSYRLQSP